MEQIIFSAMRKHLSLTRGFGSIIMDEIYSLLSIYTTDDAGFMAVLNKLWTGSMIQTLSKDADSLNLS